MASRRRVPEPDCTTDGQERAVDDMPALASEPGDGMPAQRDDRPEDGKPELADDKPVGGRPEARLPPSPQMTTASMSESETFSHENIYPSSTPKCIS